jgi:heat shock protein HtpX
MSDSAPSPLRGMTNAMNRTKTYILLAALTALFVGVGYMIGGPAGMLIALALAAAMNLFSYWNADKIVLSMYRARPVDAGDPDPMVAAFVRDVQALADGAGLPRPTVHVVDSEQPNAFATGRDPAHAAVCANLGLLRLLSRAEVRAVMAHELAHVKNRDTLTMTITATIAGAVSSLAHIAMFASMFGGRRDEGDRGGMMGTVLLAVLAPMAAGLVQLGVSRSREYEADRVGAEISGDPQALASALTRIEAYARGIPNYGAQAHPGTAHLWISNPLGGGLRDSLFSTHPSTENRVKALLAMGGSAWTAPRTETLQAAASVRRGPWG